MENVDQSNNKSLSLIAEYGASDTDSDDTETRSNDHDHTGAEDSDAAELSEMVLKNNIINACAHGPIARVNPLEVLDSTRHMIIDPAESGVVEYEVTEYRHVDSSSSSDSDSEVDSVKDVEEVSSGDENDKAAPVQPKVTGELGLDELPPIEDLAISLPAEQTTKIGTIASIVDRLVIVRALPETPAVDLDSVLFLENGAKTLGKVFDVFGPVTEPHYCVRFNSLDHVKERGVTPGMDVFIAPRTQHTSYVFIAELMRIKGSDASWLNDIEPPPHQVEYSDDEEERRAKAVRKEHNRQQREQANPQAEDSEEDTARNQNVLYTRRNQNHNQSRDRPSDSSSRFGSGPSRGRNPFSAGSRRNPNAYTRFARPWGNEVRTPLPHPDIQMQPFTAPPFQGPPRFPPFNPMTPPPSFNAFQFGGNPTMPVMNLPPMNVPPPNAPFRNNPPFPGNNPPFTGNNPPFTGNFCPQPQWVMNNAPPPPPGT